MTCLRYTRQGVVELKATDKRMREEDIHTTDRGAILQVHGVINPTGNKTGEIVSKQFKKPEKKCCLIGYAGLPLFDNGRYRRVQPD